jgi:hypothetical protein
MVPGIEPTPEVQPSRIRRVRARKAARHEAQPLCLGPYCFLKALRFIHGAPRTPFAPSLSKGGSRFL